MTPEKSPANHALPKAPTGIAGFDEATGGGLPRGRTTLLVGGSGTGKTVFALQFLAHGAAACQEQGVFVAFEEAASRIMTNAASFGWDLPAFMPASLFFLDAQPSPDLVQSGDFDMGGLLAALDAKCSQMKARRIVFDALDVMLSLLPDLAARRREIYRLHEWLIERGITAIITSKSEEPGDTSALTQNPLRAMLFMVDCTVVLEQTVVQGISQRSVRVQKYRGSSFNENEIPFLIGTSGIEVAVNLTDNWTKTRAHARTS